MCIRDRVWRARRRCSKTVLSSQFSVLSFLFSVWVEDSAVFLQPLQFFSDLDLSVPGIFSEAVAFARKQEQLAGNIKRKQSVIEEIVFEDSDADIVGAGDDVGGRADLVHLKDGCFVVITLGGLPGTSTEEVCVVHGGVIISP